MRQEIKRLVDALEWFGLYQSDLTKADVVPRLKRPPGETPPPPPRIRPRYRPRPSAFLEIGLYITSMLMMAAGGFWIYEILFLEPWGHAGPLLGAMALMHVGLIHVALLIPALLQRGLCRFEMRLFAVAVFLVPATGFLALCAVLPW